jgi:hypothetical protein
MQTIEGQLHRVLQLPADESTASSSPVAKLAPRGTARSASLSIVTDLPRVEYNLLLLNEPSPASPSPRDPTA